MMLLLRFIAVILFCISNLAHARAEERQIGSSALRLGGLVGGGLTDWVGRDADGSLPGEVAVTKPGFFAGLFATLDMNKLLSLSSATFRLGIQPVLAYITKGARFERNGEYRGSQVSMTYLQAELLFRAEYAAAGRIAPYAVLGPSIGYLRAAESRNGLGDTRSIKHNLKSTDFGLVVGVGSLLSFPPWGAASLELRADLGLVSISDTGAGREVRNAAFLLLLGYLY